MMTRDEARAHWLQMMIPALREGGFIKVAEKYEAELRGLEGDDDYDAEWEVIPGAEDPERCGICEEPFREGDEQAEMYKPREPRLQSVICHAQCGLDNEYEIA